MTAPIKLYLYNGCVGPQAMFVGKPCSGRHKLQCGGREQISLGQRRRGHYMGWGKGSRRRAKPWGVIHMFTHSLWWWLRKWIQVSTHQVIDVKHVQFIVCQLHLNKAVREKQRPNKTPGIFSPSITLQWYILQSNLKSWLNKLERIFLFNLQQLIFFIFPVSSKEKLIEKLLQNILLA